MQPHTQRNDGEQQGFYRPAQASPYQATQADTGALPPAPVFDSHDSVEWEASEYIHRSKDAKWILVFGLVVVAGLAISIWLQAWTFAALVAVMAVTMGIFAFRTPRVKHYRLTHEGLLIDSHIYSFSDFRAFGVLAEEAFFSIVLIPTKRFMPAVTMYFAQEDGEKIVDILGSHLPLEDLEPDPIDAIMRRLHF